MPIPGLAGTEHIGFTVPDLDAAERFFVDIIGCELYYSLGPYEPNGTWMADQLGVHPQARIKELRFFRCGHGPNFEIFQYESPDGQAPQPKNSDIGGHHLAFYVEDIDAAVAYLRAEGVEVMGEIWKSSGPALGQRWVYFRAPWGMQMELVSFPEGKAYEGSVKRNLWHPGRPAE